MAHSIAPTKQQLNEHLLSLSADCKEFEIYFNGYDNQFIPTDKLLELYRMALRKYYGEPPYSPAQVSCRYKSTIHDAALQSNLPLLQYIQKHRPSGSIAACNDTCITQAAVKGGSVECLKFLIDAGEEYDIHTLYAAARADQPQCLEYLLKCYPTEDHGILLAALLNESESCFHVAIRSGCKLPRTVYEKSIEPFPELVARYKQYSALK